MKTRRDFLRELIVSVGGVSALSACGDAPVVVATMAGEPGRFYTAEEMELVSRLSELVIPRTETPGALDVNVPGYIDGLMADWASEETRIAHRQALAEIERRLSDRLSDNGGFLAFDEAEAEQVLAELDRSAFAEAAMNSAAIAASRAMSPVPISLPKAERARNSNGWLFPAAGTRTCS